MTIRVREPLALGGGNGQNSFLPGTRPHFVLVVNMIIASSKKVMLE